MGSRSRVPGLLLLLGAAVTLGGIPVTVAWGRASNDLPWIAGGAVFLGAAALVWRRLPEHRVAWWFAVTAGLIALVQLFDGTLAILGDQPTDPRTMAWVNFVYQGLLATAGVAISHLVGLFPDGIARGPMERRTLRATWTLLLVPPLVLVTAPDVALPSYHGTPAVTNPYHVRALSLGDATGQVAVGVLQSVFIVGVVLLVLRYRRAGLAQRRQIRWLLLPALFGAFASLTDVLIDEPALLIHVLWIGTTLTLPASIAVALLQPRGLDVDQVLRRSVVYGALWTCIAAAYVAVGATLGMAAGQRLSIGWAVTLTVVATLAFQPARARLEHLADRWVFGTRTDPARVVASLGATLADTYDLDTLLPSMEQALEQGLGLAWARVRLAPSAPPDDREPALSVPIVLDDEHLGVVECGPRTTGALTEEDEAVVTTLARQAALAVRNVRLTTKLAAQASELTASRTRLVRAQEGERRRIERNIHDGVQQDLVALISQAGRIRTLQDRAPEAVTAQLADLQAGLQRVLAELRELARGIHPSLLSDRGLLAAVEALAARNPVPVTVRTDTSLRDLRLAEEVEGAGYFTVAESLANSLKHAAASRVEVTLSRSNGSLHIEVRDDGVGLPLEARNGEGLTNLAERLAALGGSLDVTSEPGTGTTVSATLAMAGAVDLGPPA